MIRFDAEDMERRGLIRILRTKEDMDEVCPGAVDTVAQRLSDHIDQKILDQMTEPTTFHDQSLDKFPGLSFDALMYPYVIDDSIALSTREISIWLKDKGGDHQPVYLGENPTGHWLYQLIEPAIERLVADMGAFEDE